LTRERGRGRRGQQRGANPRSLLQFGGYVPLVYGSGGASTEALETGGALTNPDVGDPSEATAAARGGVTTRPPAEPTAQPLGGLPGSARSRNTEPWARGAAPLLQLTCTRHHSARDGWLAGL